MYRLFGSFSFIFLAASISSTWQLFSSSRQLLKHLHGSFCILSLTLLVHLPDSFSIIYLSCLAEFLCAICSSWLLLTPLF
jgi:hypothetical protein